MLQLNSDAKWFMFEVTSADYIRALSISQAPPLSSCLCEDFNVNLFSYSNARLNEFCHEKAQWWFVARVMASTQRTQQQLSCTRSQHFISKSSICWLRQKIVVTYQAGTVMVRQVFACPQVEIGGLCPLLYTVYGLCPSLHFGWWFDINIRSKWHVILGTAIIFKC